MMRIRWVLGAIGLAAVVAVGLWIRQSGYDAHAEKVDKQNERAGDAAENAERAWRDCLGSGGVFEFATGKCAGADAGDR